VNRVFDINDPGVAITRDKPFYCSVPPYDPGESYPEYPFGAANAGAGDNPAYRAVRKSFMLMRLDGDNIGQPSWNPLGAIINPGNTVVIKPNLVIDKHYGGADVYSIITHPSVIRAVADYCLIAMRGTGNLIIADAPVEDCDFDNLLKVMHLKEIQALYKTRAGVDLKVLDLRQYTSFPGERMYANKRTLLSGDPAGNVVVDLGKDSALFCKAGRFYGSDPDVKETQMHHQGLTHRYQVSKTVLSCDTLISIPKMKVHKKVGVTLNLKGLVGVNTNKNYLVHYTEGTPRSGGDQAVDPGKAADTVILGMRKLISHVFISAHNPRLEKLHHFLFHSKSYLWMRAFLRRLGVVPSDETGATDGGNWPGNDTCWRMVADLARVVCYADKQGRVRDQPQRRHFSVVDGIVGGDINGPLRPRPRPEGVIVCGFNFLAVDIACARLMGFDPEKLPLFKFLVKNRRPFLLNSVGEIVVETDVPAFSGCITGTAAGLSYVPHPNWKGHIEAERPCQPSS